GSHFSNVTVRFSAFGKAFVLDLRLNRQLFSGAYVQKVFHTNDHSNKSGEASSPMWVPHSNVDHCYYHGHLRHHPGSDVAVSTCGGLRGYIIDRDNSYHLENVKGNVLRVYRGSDQRKLAFKCGTGHDPRLQEHQTILHRHRRSTKPRAPYDSNELTRYVELYLVSDYRTYERHGKNVSIVIQRSKDIANIVSSLYRQLNIYVALVGVEVWAGGDMVKVTSSADITMENFLRYRMKRINGVHHNDNAQLITGVFFDHGVVGKAIKGPICTHQFSGGVNMDYGGMVSLVATTVAHEMGHNFGMEHDNDTQCECKSDKCIMAATTEAFHLGMDYCLRNVPEYLYGGPVCGNGLKEDGEECDCGLPEDCTNQCCNPHTCQIHPLAQCATGKCCNLKTCQLKPATTLCREARGECDSPEFCNGTSEFCPNDVFFQDGTECMSGQSYCYKGHCTTHTNQCKLLWGESGRVSDPICFQQLNMKGNNDGSCGYNWTTDQYSRCHKEDVMCGLLHCVHLNEKLMFWRDNLAIDMRATFLTRGNSQYVCRSTMLDVGLDMPDPGFVPDGAKCEHNKICIKQKCVSLAKLKVKQCEHNCHGNGRCNSEGNCHCHKGYAPPLCDSPGFGGSVDSGPVSHDSDETAPVGTSLIWVAMIDGKERRVKENKELKSTLQRRECFMLYTLTHGVISGMTTSIKQNAIHVHAQFDKQDQESDKSIEKYDRVFYELAKHADFPDKEICMWGRCVLGIEDKELLSKLQLEATLTLGSVVTTTCQFEAVKLELQFQRGSTAAAAERVYHNKHRSSHGGQHKNQILQTSSGGIE
ncbi:disintegrin and metalloproteinase domain-containing protein, partial [Plakobranchus ocellatus]